jgi:hypothetical protein
MVSGKNKHILAFGFAAAIGVGTFLTFADAQQAGAPQGGGRPQGYGPAPAADYRPVVATPVVVHAIKEGVS